MIFALNLILKAIETTINSIGKNLPKIIHDIENKFWADHKKINATLVKNKLLVD